MFRDHLIPYHFDHLLLGGIYLYFWRWHHILKWQPIRSQQLAWCPPPHGCMKINFNCVVNTKSNFGAIAAVARDSQGQPHGWIGKHVQGIVDPLILEGMACREAVILVKERGCSRVIFKGDSLSVIQAIQGSSSFLFIQGIV